MKKRDEFVFKIHGDPSRWHVTVCYALLRSVKVYCDSHVLPRSPKIWCPIVTSVAKFLTVKNFATLVTINTIHSRPLAITTIPVYVLSRLPRFFPIVVIVAIVAQCKPSITACVWGFIVSHSLKIAFVKFNSKWHKKLLCSDMHWWPNFL